MGQSVLKNAADSSKRDKSYVLAVVEKNGWELEYADRSLRKDREIVLTAVSQYGFSLQYADESLKKDREIVLAATKQNGSSFRYADESLKKDREIVLEAVKRNGKSLEYADESLKKDREIVLRAVTQYGNSFLYADESLKKDREILLTAVKQDRYVLHHVDKSFKKDREFILSAAKQFDWTLEYADESLRKDREIVLEAVKNNGNSLHYADISLKKDRKIVLAAVKQNGSSLKSADESLKKDRKIVLKAVTQYGFSFQYADESLKKDREILLTAVKQNRHVLHYADESFKKDREFILSAAKQFDWTFEYADESLRKDREIVLEAVKRNGDSLEYADEYLKKDREIVLEAVKKNGDSLRYADISLKKDGEILLTVFSQNGYSLRNIDNLLHPDVTIIIESLPTEYYKSLNTKYEVLKKIDTGSINQKLSKGIIENYSKKYLRESDLFYYLYFKDLSLTVKSNAINIFNLGYNYSTKFIEKLLIIDVLKNISEKFPHTKPLTHKTIDYFLFCFKLDKFLEEHQSEMEVTNFTNVASVVNSISSKFKVYYAEKEVQAILHFYDEWTSDMESFENYRNILVKYHECGEAKIMKVYNEYYNYSKNERTNYEIISVLGHGAEGVVFKAYDKHLKKYVALKITFEVIDYHTAKERMKFLLNDIEGKIKCYETNLIGHYLYSIMEIGEESLSQFISRNNNLYKHAPITKDYLIEILTIFTKILNSVQNIHDHSIIHRDLDPNNIVKIGNQYKIIDFDIAKVASTGKSITLNVGKYSYMSPEISSYNYATDLVDDDKLTQNIGGVSVLSDVFSLGCILLKLLTNGSLMLDKQFLHDSNYNCTSYNESFRYFVWDGVYLYKVLTDSTREKKLHYAIEKTINQYIDPKFGVNNFLSQCLITMLQEDPKKRLTCFTHKNLLEQVIKYLKNEPDCTISMNDYAEIPNLNDILIIEKLRKDNMELKIENLRLKQFVIILFVACLIFISVILQRL